MRFVHTDYYSTATKTAEITFHSYIQMASFALHLLKAVTPGCSFSIDVLCLWPPTISGRLRPG